MQYLLIFIAGLIQIASCNSTEENKSQTDLNSAKSNWTVLLTGQQCDIEEGKNVIIKSQKDFDNLWNEMHSDRPDQPEKPNVNFQSKWVITCFLGNVSSAGHSIEIKTITNQKDETIINLLHKKPGPDCITAQVIESPYVLASIDQFKPDMVKFRIDILNEKCE